MIHGFGFAGCIRNAVRAGARMAFLAVAVVAVLSQSCADRHTPMESLVRLVPDDAVVVRTVNLSRLMTEAGCPTPVSGGKLLPDAAKVLSLMAEPDYRDALVALLAAGNAVDFSRMVNYTTADGRDMILLDVLDGKKVEEALGNVSDTGRLEEDAEGVTFCNIGGVVAVVDDDGQHCILGPDLMTVLASGAKARNSHFGTLIGIDEFLERPYASNLAINCGNSMLSYLGGKSKWLCVSFNVTRQSVSVIGEVMDRDGKTDSIGANFDEINTDFLRYTPEGASVVLAFGRFHGNVRGLSMLLGRFAPLYLSQADGTTSLYAMPVSGNPEAVREQTPGSWAVETMVHVPQDQIAVGLDQYMEKAGSRLEKISDTQWEYFTDTDNYYFGTYDGCLLFSSNREISGNCNNGFTDDFTGKRAAIVVDIPTGSVLSKAWGLDYGLTFKVFVETMEWNARISFNGTGMPALKALLNMPQLPDLHARYNRMAGL